MSRQYVQRPGFTYSHAFPISLSLRQTLAAAVSAAAGIAAGGGALEVLVKP